MPVDSRIRTFAMPFTWQLHLSAPLFVLALLAVRRKWASIMEPQGQWKPPRVQCVDGFCRKNCKRSQISGRRRAAFHASRLLAEKLRTAGIVAPAGCIVGASEAAPDPDSKSEAWLRCLADLSAQELTALLSGPCDRSIVMCTIKVEQQYNSAVRALKDEAFQTVQPGTIAAWLTRGQDAPEAPIPVRQVTKGATGTFYYIGAGVGCGIEEAEKVRPLSTANRAPGGAQAANAPSAMRTCGYTEGVCAAAGGIPLRRSVRD